MRLKILLVLAVGVASVAGAQPNLLQPSTPYPHGDPCVDAVYYQRNIDLEWMIKGGTPGHTYQGGSNHAFAVIDNDFLHYGVIGQGCTTCGYKKPPSPGPALDWWDKCFVSPRHISGYMCETAVVPTGTQVYQMRTLAQVTNPAKKASWAAQYGCGTATPTPTVTPVPVANPYAAWIEQLFQDGITAGCGAGKFCPKDQITREQLAVWLVKAMHGSTFVPPPCTGVFVDVPCQ